MNKFFLCKKKELEVLYFDTLLDLTHRRCLLAYNKNPNYPKITQFVEFENGIALNTVWLRKKDKLYTNNTIGKILKIYCLFFFTRYEGKVVCFENKNR